MKGLRISPQLTLPLDAATETFWFLGKRGSGKTHNCSVLVEEMLKAGIQVVILDPMTAWYGLRSSIDGKSPGLPITIFGGPHGDVPLEPSAGELMADIAVNERLSMILDMKAWSKADRRRFVTAFLLRLLATNEDAMHVVLEEAARFAPQRPEPADGAMLGACMDLVQLGRGSGLGASLISQRSATISKEVSSQTSVLVAHRTVAPLDIKAAKEWFAFHEDDRVDAAMKRVPTLATGTALMLSPELEGGDLFAEVTFRPRETFDSSATPKVGQARRVARTFADVDLDAIRALMAEQIERADAVDPRKLQAKVRELERTIATLEAAPAKVAPPVVHTEYAIPPEVLTAAANLAAVDVTNGVPTALSVIEGVLAPFRAIISARDALVELLAKVPVQPATKIERGRAAAVVNPGPHPGDGEPSHPTKDRAAPPVSLHDSRNVDDQLPEGERTVLVALAQLGALDRDQLSIVTGYARSSRNTILQKLRDKGYVEATAAGAPCEATPAGIAAVADAEPLPTGAALLEYWLAKLPEGEARLLSLVADAWPELVSRDALSEASGYARSTRNTILQRLAARKLITTGTAGVGASDHLFG